MADRDSWKPDVVYPWNFIGLTLDIVGDKLVGRDFVLNLSFILENLTCEKIVALLIQWCKMLEAGLIKAADLVKPDVNLPSSDPAP